MDGSRKWTFEINRYLTTFSPQERREEYFVWAKQVVDNLRGTNAALEEKLDEIFRERNLLWMQ